MNAEKRSGDLVGKDEENIGFLSFATFRLRRTRRSLGSRRVKNVHELWGQQFWSWKSIGFLPEVVIKYNYSPRKTRTIMESRVLTWDCYGEWRERTDLI